MRTFADMKAEFDALAAELLELLDAQSADAPQAPAEEDELALAA